MSDWKKRLAFTALIAAAVFAFCMFAPADFAFAEGKVGLAVLIESLKHLITVLLLPIAIIINAWRIIYIAVFCGMIGTDPLNMVSDSNQDGGVSGSEVSQAIKAHLMGFFHGLLWIGGLFLIFQFALTIAGILASTLAENF